MVVMEVIGVTSGGGLLWLLIVSLMLPYAVTSLFKVTTNGGFIGLTVAISDHVQESQSLVDAIKVNALNRDTTN